ncbi:MAG: arginine deiminase-related protein [Chitinophagaceae bacterium]
MQNTSHILMIRPVNFTFNAETAVNNAFQVSGQASDAHEKAVKEFDALVATLRNNDVDVLVVDDTPEPHTPDSIFPNNWVSFHEDGTICLYPMFADNRRDERKPTVLEQVSKRFVVKQLADFTHYEDEESFLEGTGSMVLDRDNKIAYACLSPRTNENVLDDFCETMGYESVIFDAVDAKGQPIYHTNVLMCVADKYVVICLDCIPNEFEREIVKDSIAQSGKELIEISMDQLNHFAGNMLQVKNQKGDLLLVMSSQAWNSLTPEQQYKLNTFNIIIHAPLTTIETNGGGSARCMMAEIFLPTQKN